MYKINRLRLLQTLFVLFAFSSCSFAQSAIDNNGTFNLHVNFQPTQGEVVAQNLGIEEASVFDAPAYIASNRKNGIVRIFGRHKTPREYKYYSFDSSKLEDNGDCPNYCEKITSLERVPFLGFAVNPTDDFIGVEIVSIVPGSNASDSPLQPGDIITSIETLETTNPCQLTQAVNDQTVDHWVEVSYIRKGKSRSTMILMGYRIKKNVTWVACCDNNPTKEPLTITSPSNHLDLDIFPNPTAGITQFEIGTSSINKTTIQLMNMNGQVLKEMEVFPIDGYWQDYLDLAQYADGVYVLHVTQDKAKISKRVVLQKK